MLVCKEVTVRVYTGGEVRVYAGGDVRVYAGGEVRVYAGHSSSRRQASTWLRVAWKTPSAL